MDSIRTDRRRILQGIGAVPAALANPALLSAANVANGASNRPARRMVIRADDIGHSQVCNIGTFQAISCGLIGAADIMLDSPGTDDALHRLKSYPWISIGWHMHMWGAPVLNTAEVPSLIERGGEFNGRFRTDLARAEDVSFDEAVHELRAQLARCRRILGKYPDTGNPGKSKTPWVRAARQVCDEAKIVYNFSSTQPTPPEYTKHVKEAQSRGEEWAKYYSVPNPLVPADPKWQDRKITGIGTAAFIDLLTDSVSSVERNYDAVKFYLEDRSGILRQPADVITWQAWHPGYVDYYVYRLGERVNRARAQQFVVSRTQDVAAMCDQRLRNWVRINRIQLINFRDALYGTHEFQTHLKAIGSELAIA